MGAALTAFHWPFVALEDGKGWNWPLLPLEVAENILQPSLLFLAMTWCPFRLSWWGNNTLGTYIFHFYVWENMGAHWLPSILKHTRPAGGFVQVLAILSVPILISTI